MYNSCNQRQSCWCRSRPDPIPEFLVIRHDRNRGGIAQLSDESPRAISTTSAAAAAATAATAKRHTQPTHRARAPDAACEYWPEAPRPAARSIPMLRPRAWLERASLSHRQFRTRRSRAARVRLSDRIRRAYFRADSGMRNAPPVFVAATRNPLLITRSKMVLSPRPVFSSAHVSPLVFE